MIRNIIILTLVLVFLSCQSNQKEDEPIDTNQNKNERVKIDLSLENPVFNILSHSDTNNYPLTFFDKSILTDKNNVPIDSNQYYFPLLLFPQIETELLQDENNKISIKTKILYRKYDTTYVEWYSQQLYAINEPLLFNKYTNSNIYRFTWLRSFHSPVIVRIEKACDNYKLIWKIIDNSKSKNLYLKKSIQISKTEWDIFQAKLKSMDFWEMNVGRIGFYELDGAEWILEGSEETRYKVIVMCSPYKNEFFNACFYLLSLTDLKLEENEIY